MIENNASECKDWVTQCDPEHVLRVILEQLTPAFRLDAVELFSCLHSFPCSASCIQVLGSRGLSCSAGLKCLFRPTFFAVILTRKVGQTGLVFGVWSGLTIRCAHARLQVSVCSSYKLNLSFTKTFRQADPGYRQSGLFVVTWPYDWSID